MFKISELALGNGVLGIAPLPGRGGQYDADLIALFQWNPALVMTLNTSEELQRAHVPGLGSDLIAAGLQWSHLPVADFGAPSSETEALFKGSATHAHAILATGGRVLAHCYGGCGRSGMALLRLMVEAGEAPEDALIRLRAVRPCAVETEAQFKWASRGQALGQ